MCIVWLGRIELKIYRRVLEEEFKNDGHDEIGQVKMDMSREILITVNKKIGEIRKIF